MFPISNAIRRRVAFVGLVAASLAASASHAQTSCESLTITGHPTCPPVAWASRGEIIGAAPALVTQIARKLGVRTVTSTSYGSWEAAQEATRKGEADVIFGIYRNSGREQYLNYVAPAFMLDPVAIVVRKGDNFTFNGWADLVGRKGVTNLGESYGDKFDAFIKAQLTVARADGVKKAFETLLDKQADYMIVGLYPGRNEAATLGIAAALQFLPKAAETAEMYVAFSKRSRCYPVLAKGFSDQIAAAVRSKEVDRLLAAAEKESRKP